MKLFGRDEQKAEAASAHQSRIDAIVAAARAQAPTLEPRPRFREVSRAPLIPSDDLLDQRLSEELACARRTLDSIGDQFCGDPILLTRYQILLQSFDLLGQTIGHVGAIVGAADRADAVERVGMVELRARLQRPQGGVEATAPSLVRTENNPFSQH